jgi:hypothetical protein
MIGEGTTLEKFLADRLATEAARIAEERIRAAFDVTPSTRTRSMAS